MKKFSVTPWGVLSWGLVSTLMLAVWLLWQTSNPVLFLLVLWLGGIATTVVLTTWTVVQLVRDIWGLA